MFTPEWRKACHRFNEIPQKKLKVGEEEKGMNEWMNEREEEGKEHDEIVLLIFNY